jgi:hypothetical protein
MIGTVKKPLQEVLDALQGHERIAVVGCNGCARVSRTGGEEQVAELAQTLRDHGKETLLEVTPERTCYVQKTRKVLDPLQETLAEADALCVLGCGGAVQITRQVTEGYGLTKPVKVALDSVGHMDTIQIGELAVEQCQECGACVLNDTGGICPVTRCAKSLLNGPCGGAQDGRCEVDPERDCAWVQIYHRLAALDELDRLRDYVAPKDQSKAAKPRKLDIKRGKVA